MTARARLELWIAGTLLLCWLSWLTGMILRGGPFR